MKHRVLNHADNIIHGARQRDYGSASHSFSTIADLWSAYLGHEVTPEQVCMMMILLKVGRSTKSAQFDSLVDIAGYAALADTVIDEAHYEQNDLEGISF
jgi:hypothetical protein